MTVQRELQVPTWELGVTAHAVEEISVTLESPSGAVQSLVSTPRSAAGWMVLAARRRADLWDATVAARSLQRLGLGTVVVDLSSAGGDDATMASTLHAVRSWLAAGPAAGSAIGLGGAGLGAPVALAAARGLEREVPAVILWNGCFDTPPQGVNPLSTPALLLLDRKQPWRDRRAQRAMARGLGSGSELVVARSLSRDADRIVREWYEDTLRSDRPASRPAIRPAVRRSAAGLAAVAAFASPAAAVASTSAGTATAPSSRFSTGKVLTSAHVAGDGFGKGAAAASTPGDDRPSLARHKKEGKKLSRNRIHGDGFPSVGASHALQMLDGGGINWKLQADVTFSTTSSASGAMSEASATTSGAVTTASGGTVESTVFDAFDGYNSMAVHVGAGAPTTPVSTGDSAFTIYNNNGAPTTDCDGQETVFNPQSVGSLTMSRKVYVPNDDSFARWQNIFVNEGPDPIDVTMYVANNLGSDRDTRVFDSSDGNTTAELTDRWVGSFQNYSGTTSSDPRLGHVLQGPGAPVPLSDLNFVDGDDNPYWTYTFSLAPGETKTILNYAVVELTKAAAAAKAESLSTDPSVACMNPADRSQVANFQIDETAPVLSLPAKQTLEATGPAGAKGTWSASAVDAVDGPVPVSCTPASGATFPLGTTTVTCTATDANGNVATGSFDVTVRDTTAPVLSAAPADQSFLATSAAGATATYTPPTASDAVDGTVPVSCTPAPGATIPTGRTTVTCTAVDSRGNRATASFAIAVGHETTPPTTHVVRPSSRRQPIMLRGTGTGGDIQSVYVSLARQVGKQCRFLQSNGSFSAARDCRRTLYVKAQGTTSWRLKLPTLARGRYTVWSRGVDQNGNVELKQRPRNLTIFFVRKH